MTDSTTENVPETKKTSSGWLAPFFELNFIEMMERLAYNSVRVVAPIYIMQADNVGGLHLTAAAKGTLYAWWAVVQCFLPIITGGFADRYGYKKMMVISVATMSIGYLLMAFLRDLPSLDALAGTLAFDGVNGSGALLATWQDLHRNAPFAVGCKRHSIAVGSRCRQLSQ